MISDNLKQKWIGLRFDNLIIKDVLPNRKAKCICDCGNETIVFRNNLGRGNTTSCGCVHSSKIKKIKTLRTLYESEYRSWSMMKNRCLNPNSDQYKWYKDKTICNEWIGSFDKFIMDMGEKPEPKSKYSIERKDNLKGYYPDNCKWATMKEQNNNRRKRNSVI